MAAQLEWKDEAGLLLASFDFPVTTPGASRTKIFLCRNTGTTPATNAALEVGAVGGADMENWLTAEVSGVTGRAGYEAPLSLGSIAAGQELQITVSLAVPQGAPLSTVPVMASCQITYDQEG